MADSKRQMVDGKRAANLVSGVPNSQLPTPNSHLKSEISKC